MSLTEQPHAWHTTNLVGVPGWHLGSLRFNEKPECLHIGGTRDANTGLFALLDRCRDQEEAAEVFAHFMALAFCLQPDQQASTEIERRRWRSSYLKLLQGWGADSNGQAGAVLKGWASSRFGLVPRFHRETLDRFPSPAWVGYLEEKFCSRYHNNCIDQQLDLLYEFCQWCLQRFRPFGGTPWVTLWRGVSRAELPKNAVGSARPSTPIELILNNVVSLSSRLEHAQCFGDWVLKIKVPVAKIICFPGLLNHVALNGECEVIALGGTYMAEVCHG